MRPVATINVLLVDDDPGDAVLLRAALTAEAHHRFSIRTVDRLEAAAAALQDGPVDVVLLDLGLPDSVGLATFDAFHAAAPGVAVVILTHLADDDLAVEAVRRGAQDYVVKGSVDELQLARTVRHAAQRGRLQADVARLAEHQAVLAELGLLSGEDPPLDEQFARTAELIGTCLDARLALVLQRRADGRLVVQTSVGDEGLEGELLPPLLTSRFPRTDAQEPLLLEDFAALDSPGMRETPAALRQTENLLVLPLRGVAWSGALVLVDTPAVHHGTDTLVFVRAVGTLLEEALRRTRAELDLEERAKELSALAAVGRILQEQAPDEALLAGVAHAVVDGMQFPDRAVARVEVDDIVVISDGGRAGLAEQLTAPIVVNGEQRGEVAVGHRGIHGFLDGYEQQLVDAVVENLSLWLERNDTLRRVRDSERQLRSVLEQAPGLVWTVGTDMRVVWHAGRAHEQIAQRPNESQGRHLGELFGGDHPIIGAVHEALAGRTAMYESTGHGRSFETRVEPVRGDDGEVVGAIGIGVDVTEQLAAQRELTESRRRLEGLFNHAHDAFLLVDDDGRYLDANPAAARLTGYSVEQLRGMTLSDLRPDGATGTAAAEFASFRKRRHASGEWPLRCADGKVIDTQYDAVADIVPGVHLSVVTDVTERKRAEAALRSSEERFRRLAENAQDVIYHFTVVGEPRFEYVSPAVETLIGVSPEEFYADPAILLRLLDDEDLSRLQPSITDPHAEWEPFVARMRHTDGTDIWIEERHSYVFDAEGRHIGTEGVVRDVTARKQVEEELRRGLAREQAVADELRTLNEMKDVFLTAVSHELRTPLTSLKGLSHTLRHHDSRLPEEQRATLLDRIAANADRLEGLLEDLLDLDRLTRGITMLDLCEVDVAELVRRTLEGLPAAGRMITTHLQPVQALLDDAKVERIVENLVANALRHTSADVPVWVRVEPEDDGVAIRVEDAGPGVPEHLHERIFEAFEMGDSPAARVGGLGIGLNLVARFVELHGGTACVGERDGGGASFRVWLPRRPHNDQAASRTDQDAVDRVS